MNDMTDGAMAALKREVSQEIAADIARSKRDWMEFERLVRELGLCNCLASMAGVASDRQSEFPEGSDEEKDFIQAQNILEIASMGCDLTYGTNKVRAKLARSEAISKVKQAAAELYQEA